MPTMEKCSLTLFSLLFLVKNTYTKYILYSCYFKKKKIVEHINANDSVAEIDNFAHHRRNECQNDQNSV